MEASIAGADLPWLAEPLRQAVQQQRGHALLVQGAAGAGQFAFVLALARAWLCDAPQSERSQGLACGRCGSCHLAQSDQAHPDLFVLVPETMHVEQGWWQKDDDRERLEAGSRKPSEWIRIEQVRAAIEFAARTRSRARAKVVVIYPAERLQVIAASALLKLLEEPQGGLRLALGTADAAALLPTVRSRCQALALPPPDPVLAARWLHETGIEDAEILLAASGGQPLAAFERHARGLVGPLWRRLPQYVREGDALALAKIPLPLAIESLHKLCHDAMAIAVGAPPRYFPADKLPAAGLRLAPLVQWERRLTQTARHADHPWNAALLLESLVGQGKQALSAGNVSVHSRR